GNGGVVNLPSAVNELAIVPDGRILAVVGSNFSPFSVERFGPGGTPDPTFGTGGVAPIPNSVNNNSTLTALPDGGALVGWSPPASVGETSGVNLVRLTASGAVDPTFGTSGTAVVSAPSGSGSLGLSAVVIQPDGRVLLVGSEVQQPGPSTAS